MSLPLHIFLLLGLPCADAPAQRGSFLLSETGSPLTVTLTNPAPNNWGYHSLSLRNGAHAFYLAAEAPLQCVPKSRSEQLETGMLVGHIGGLQLDASRCFFRGSYSSASGTHTLLFFIGEPGASHPGPALVVGFDQNGKPFKMLEINELNLVAFESNDSGQARFIGRPTTPQAMSCAPEKKNEPYAETYDPFSVYVMTAEARFTYSFSESKAYNLQHYVWAGPKSREDYGVVYNVDGHHRPIGATPSRIDVLLKKGTCKS